jgi:hypothetical protein
VTSIVGNLCNGQTTCTFLEGNALFGDKAYGCSKDFSVTYAYGSNTSLTTTEPASSNEGYRVTLPSTAQNSPILPE